MSLDDRSLLARVIGAIITFPLSVVVFLFLLESGRIEMGIAVLIMGAILTAFLIPPQWGEPSMAIVAGP
jgi:hypothetical protein